MAKLRPILIITASIIQIAALNCLLLLHDAHAWTIQTAASKPTYSTASTRTLRINKTNNMPHMAFGGDYLYHAYFDGLQWKIETVDKTPNVGAYASLAIDNNGKQHISYYDSTNGELRYATNSLGTWMTIALDVGGVGTFNAIAVDSNNRVHISYSDMTNRALKYATNISGAWEIFTLDTGLATNGYTSLAIDSADKIHIAYSGATALKYATNTLGTWDMQTVDSVAAGFPSLALDTSGKAHISYNVGTIKGVKHATNKDGTWANEVVAIHASDRWFGFGTSIDLDSSGVAHITWYQSMLTNGVFHATNEVAGTWNVAQVANGAGWFVGDFSSVAIDSQGKVHITHYNTNTYNYYYTNNTSGNWSTLLVNVAGYIGEYTSIAVDSNSRAHIACFEREGANLKLVTNQAGWASQTIDATGSTPIGIAIDSNGNDHISYYNNYTPRYATNASGSWVSQPVDPTDVSGRDSSITIDTGNHAHIAFRGSDSVNWSLKYATNATGSWVMEIADLQPGLTLGEYTSIAIDSTNAPHISYHDTTNGDLKYATKPSGGSWAVSVVDSAGVVGMYTSVAVDSVSTVHVSYYDSTNGDLKYASKTSAGSWVLSTLDSTGDVGAFSSLRVDTNNKVHIAYYDSTNKNLKYATNASGAWVLSAVDSAGSSSSYSYISLALDKNRRAHISYFDVLNRDLKYATNAAIDTTPPGGTFSINNNAAYTNSSDIILSLNCIDLQSSCLSMQFSNDNTIWSSNPVNYAPSKSWTMKSGDGLKYVYVRFMDSWGNWSNQLVSTITIDSQPPSGSMTINSDASVTNIPAVTLALACTDSSSGCSQMKISNDNATWTVYALASSVSWNLSAGDGSKTVYTQYKDVAGNWSPSIIKNITLDTTPPSMPIVTGTTPVNTQTPTWTWSSGGGGIGGTLSYRYKLDDPTMASPTSTSSTSYTPASALAPGTHTLYVQEQDSAGNWSASGSSAIIIDSTPPGAPVVSGSALTSNNRPTWTWASGGGGSGSYRYRLDNSDLTSGATITAIRSFTPVDALNDGNHTLYVQEQDDAGNWSGSGQYLIPIDTTPPETKPSPTGSSYNAIQIVSLGCTDSGGAGCAGTWYSIDANPPTVLYTGPITIPNSAVLTFYSRDSLGNREADQTTDYTYIQGKTLLTLELSKPTIDFGGSVMAWGRLQNNSGNNADPTGKTITLTLTDPKGVIITPALATTIYDSLGNFIFPAVAGFSQKGTYTLRASFGGSSLLATSASITQPLLVGASAGYAILIEGKIASQEGLKSHNKTANRIYGKLKQRGFADDNIYYFNYQSQTGVDTTPSLSQIKYSIEEWAKERMNGLPAPLYVIMVDHGDPDAFYINTETITPTLLGSWLTTLEGGLTDEALLEKRVVIIGSCYSGTFINQLSRKPEPNPELPQRPDAGRVIITSAAPGEVSYKGPMESDTIRSGEYFLEELFTQLERGETIRQAFIDAADKTRTYTQKGGGSANSNAPYFDGAVQHPLLDDNGDHIGSNTLTDGELVDGSTLAAMQLGIGATYNVNSAQFPVDLLQVSPTVLLDAQTSALLWAKVTDDDQVDSAVWIEIRKPDLILATPTGNGPTEQADLNTTRIPLLHQNGRWEIDPASVGFPFDQSGTYTIFYFVRDKDTLKLAPMKQSKVYRSKDTNHPPGTFQLLAPANASEQATIALFSWTPAADQDLDPLTYTLQISQDPGFSSIDYRLENISETMAAVGSEAGLIDHKTYYWNVLAIDSYGAVSQSSATWSFTTNNPNSLPARIKGYVFNNQGSPLSEATVTAKDGNGTVITSGTTIPGGAFILLVTPGSYSLSTTAAGYAPPAEIPVSLGSGDVLSLTPLYLVPSNPTLQVTLLGDGSGSLHGTLSCSSGTCSSTLASGTPVTLTATAEWNALFAGWNGSYCSGSLLTDCSFTLTAAASITATFTPNYQARSGGNYYSSLQTALNSAGNGATVEVMEYDFLEPILFNRSDISVTIDGGRGPGYGAALGGYSTVSGFFRIQRGTVKIMGPLAVR